MRLQVYVIAILMLILSGIQLPQAFAEPQTENMVSIAEFQVPLPGPEILGNIRNVSYSAQLVNGTIIKPGEVFSFNKTVGPRTLERGFAWSESIGWTSRGYARIKDVGGGVCRTSTTIHQAALKAGLTVLERHNHSIAVEYATPGDDAAVWYNTWDYKFRNNRNNPIKIETSEENGQLVVTIKEFSPYTILVEGQTVALSAVPFLANDQMMVPVRSVLKQLAANLHWDQSKQTLTVTTEDQSIELNTRTNETGLVLLKNNTLYMPARALATLAQCELEWNSTIKAISFKKLV